jgi:GNAT superfamily N-acetyltransferase
MADEKAKLEVKTVSNRKDAIRVWKMFLIPNIIGPLSDGEKQRFKENILNTLDNPRGAFFYVESDGKVIGAVGAWENYIKNGGFVIEHYAVVEEYRGRCVGKELFLAAEKFVLKQKPRYIIIETGDDPLYESGRRIYERNGYKKVSHFPKYYAPTSGRMDYMKVF